MKRQRLPAPSPAWPPAASPGAGPELREEWEAKLLEQESRGASTAANASEVREQHRKFGITLLQALVSKLLQVGTPCLTSQKHSLGALAVSDEKQGTRGKSTQARLSQKPGKVEA